MFFGSNRVTVTSPDNFTLNFDPIEALKTVSKSAEAVPIRIAASHADFWRQLSQSETVFDYDWTYTPQSYQGTVNSSAGGGNEDCLEIDYERLKRQDPILFFDENILYEDELGDNGISMISVKLVINTCFHSFIYLFLESNGFWILHSSQPFSSS